MKRKWLAFLLVVTLVASIMTTGVAAAEESVGALAQHASASAAADALYSGLWNCQERIDLRPYDITVDQLSDMYYQTAWLSPELFHLSDRYSYSFNNNRVIEVYPTYTVTGEPLLQMRAAYEQKLLEIAAGVDTAWSDLEIALYLHDYLVAHYAYDTTYTHYDAYTLLTTGTGVCQAYALTYMALLQRFSIPVDYVVSDAMNHAWNAVQLDGHWYHVDVTWDDPVGQSYGVVSHRNFLLSDAAMLVQASPHHDWQFTQQARVCSDTRYDAAMWMQVYTPFVPLQGQWYYIAQQENGNYALCATDWQRSQPVLPMTDRWSAGESSYWLGSYAGLGQHNGRLLWNTPDAIVSWNPQTGDTTTVFENTDSRQLYGLTVDGTQVTYVRKASPNEREEQRGVLMLSTALNPTTVWGDVDGNGVVTGADALLVLRAAAGELALNEQQQRLADVDGQAGVTILDALYILQYVSGQVTALPAA